MPKALTRQQCRRTGVWSLELPVLKRTAARRSQVPTRVVMKDKELVRRNRELRVRPSFVVREFNFAGTIEELHHGADLTSNKAVRRHIRKKGYDIRLAGCDGHSWRLRSVLPPSVAVDFSAT